MFVLRPCALRFCGTRARQLLTTLLFALLGYCTLTPARAAEPATLRVTFTQLAASPLITPSTSIDHDAWLKQLSTTIRAAEGNRVEITGYLLPLKIEQGRTKEFLLMRDQSGCCYGKMPVANEYLVASASSAGIPATLDVPVTIRGTLRIAPLFVDGVLSQFYTLENAAGVRL